MAVWKTKKSLDQGVRHGQENEAESGFTGQEMMLEEFLKPMKLSQYRLAKETGVPQYRIGEIVVGKRSITADTDLRMCHFLGLSDGW
ncbi:MAG: HigA family addiction module antitoxin [Acidiferrobacterales bacterium]